MSTARREHTSGSAGTDGGIGSALARGASPYATGGGGVTFERKVAVQYLAHLLVGDGSRELGDGRRVVSVEFQRAPDHPVDDLVVSAAQHDELEPSLVLAISVRRSPQLVSSDEKAQKLVRAFVDAVLNAPTDGPEHQWCLAAPQRGFLDRQGVHAGNSTVAMPRQTGGHRTEARRHRPVGEVRWRPSAVWSGLCPCGGAPP